MLVEDRPLVAASDLLRWSALTEKRDRKGSEWCSERGIGREVDRIKVPTSALPFSKSERSMRLAITQAEETLRLICRECPLRCPRR